MSSLRDFFIVGIMGAVWMLPPRGSTLIGPLGPGLDVAVYAAALI